MKHDVISVSMASDGEVIEITKNYTDYNLGEGFENYRWGKEYPNNPDTMIMTWCIYTSDMKNAVQTVNAKRLQILAGGCWGDTDKTLEMLKKIQDLRMFDKVNVFYAEKGDFVEGKVISFSMDRNRVVVAQCVNGEYIHKLLNMDSLTYREGKYYEHMMVSFVRNRYLFI